MLIHYGKTFATYSFLASSLVGLSRELGIRAFGTDGEEALSDAFKHEFGFAQRLTSFIHVRRNLKDKLAQCNIPVDLSQKILDDVFGKKLGSVFVEGIVDASDDSDFQNKLDAVTQVWHSCSLPSTANLERFIDYLMVSKASVIRDTMLRCVREECCLGCPPDIFTTNASESVSAVLKRKVDYKWSELPVFIDKLRNLFKSNSVKLNERLLAEASIASKSSTVFWKFLRVSGSGSKWFMMNTEQRRRHLSQVQSTQVTEASEGFSQFDASDPPATEAISVTNPVLSVDLESASEQVNIPIKCSREFGLKQVN